MIKIKKSISLSIFFMAFLFKASISYAFVPIILPPTPTMDAKTIGTMVIDGMTTVNNLKSNTDKVGMFTEFGEKIGVDMSFSKDLTGKVDGLVAKGQDGAKKLVSSARNVKKKSSVDFSDEKAVSDLFYSQFLYIPGPDPEGCFPRSVRDEFYVDTLAEIASNSEKLLKKIDVLQKSLKDFGEIVQKGAPDVGEADNRKFAYEMEYQTAVINSEVVRLVEELNAMELQYLAVNKMMFTPAQTKADLDAAKKAEKEAAKKSKKDEKDAEKKAKQEEKEAKKKAKQESKVSSAGYLKGQIFAHNENISFAQMAEEEDSDEDSDGDIRALFSSSKLVEAEAPNIDSPFANSREDLAAIKTISEVAENLYEVLEIHNTMNSLPQYRDAFINYHRYVSMHKKALENLTESEECIVDYLGNFYQHPQKVWSGSSSPVSADSMSIRSGVSKLLYDTYQTAKANTVLVDVTGDVTGNIITPIETYDDLSTIKKDDVKLNDDMSEAREKEVRAESRSVDLLPWQIAAQISRNLANDQHYNKKWGNPKKTFPIWNDHKNFYNQYLDYKYDNMIEYINRLDLRPSEVEIVKILSVGDKGKSNIYHEKWLGSLASMIVVDKNQSEGSGVKSYKDGFDSMVKDLEGQKEKALKNLKVEAKYVAEQRVRINEDIAKYSDMGNLQEDEAFQTKVLGENMKTFQPKYSTAELKKMIEAKKVEKEKLEKKAGTLQDSMEAIETAYSAKFVELEKKLAKDMNKYVSDNDKKYKKPETLLNLFNNRIAKNMSPLDIIGVDAIRSFQNMLGTSHSMMEDVNKYAIEAIQKTRRDLYSLGDGLYIAENNNIVVKAHRDLIDKLSSIDAAELLSSSVSISNAYSAHSAVLPLLIGVYRTSVINNICKDINCRDADKEYFASLVANKKDFTAPKAPIEEYLPPVREAMYFDLVNYQKLSLSDKGNIAKQDFLNSEFYMPKIWKVALGGFAFVDRDIDMAKFLGEDDNIQAIQFYRSGIYPCSSNGKVIDVDKNAKYVMLESYNKAIPKCRDISLSNSSFYGVIKDLENEDVKGTIGNGVVVDTSKAGELGRLFKYSDGNVRFRPAVLDMFKQIEKVNEYAYSDKNYNQTIKDTVYFKSKFDKGQFSDYLYLQGIEREYRKNRDEQKVSLDDMKKNLMDILKGLGFSPSNDLDLSKESDYNYVFSTLKNTKGSLLSQGKIDLVDIKTINSDFVAGRLEPIQKLMYALEVDDEALINISTEAPNKSDLAQQIATTKANLKISSEYDKEGAEAFDKAMRELSRPYCASY